MSAPKKDRTAEAIERIAAAMPDGAGLYWTTTSSKVEGQRLACRLRSPLGYAQEDGVIGFPILIRPTRDAAEVRDDFVAVNAGSHAAALQPEQIEAMERFRRRLHKLPGARRTVAGNYGGSPDPVERHLGRAVQFDPLLTAHDPAALQELVSALEELACKLGGAEGEEGAESVRSEASHPS